MQTAIACQNHHSYRQECDDDEQINPATTTGFTATKRTNSETSLSGDSRTSVEWLLVMQSITIPMAPKESKRHKLLAFGIDDNRLN